MLADWEGNRVDGNSILVVCFRLNPGRALGHSAEFFVLFLYSPGYVFGGAVEDAPASAPSSPEGPTLARLQASKQVQKANARKLVPKKGRLGLNQPLAGGSPDSRPAKRARQVPTRYNPLCIQ